MAQPANSPAGDFGIFDFTPPTVEDGKERSTRALSRTKQWKQQLEYLQGRIEYWQHFLPNGTPINTLTAEQRAQAWVDADNAIREINLWIMHVESSNGLNATER